MVIVVLHCEILCAGGDGCVGMRRSWGDGFGRDGGRVLVGGDGCVWHETI